MKTYTEKRFKQLEKLIKKLRRLQFEGYKEEDYHNLLIKVRRTKKYAITMEMDATNRHMKNDFNYMM